MTDEQLVLPNHPYKGKFSTEQVREALDRKDALVALLMDPVGPDGTLINIPVDMLHILCFHLAYAGADAHTDSRRLIESRLCRDPDAMFELYEWRPVGEFGDTAPAQDDVSTEAAGIAATMKQQLTPERPPRRSRAASAPTPFSPRPARCAPTRKRRPRDGSR